jgi:hypothetical protein
MSPDEPVRLVANVLSSTDPSSHGAFYAALLSWPITYVEEQWVMLRNPLGGPGLSFQYEEHFLAPVWTGMVNRPQMTIHLDLHVEDVASSTRRSIAPGATIADVQPQDDV